MPRGHMMADVFWMQFVCVCVRQTLSDVSDVLLVRVFIRVQWVFT